MKNGTKRLFLTFFLFSVLFGWLYSSAYTYMFKLWDREDFAYCYYVPFIVAYLIWEKRHEIALVPSAPSWSGQAVFMSGISLFWLGELGGEYYSIFISSWLLLVGFLWLNLGLPKLRIIAFPMVFLLAMFPLPNVIYNNMTLKLKLISSQLGVGIIRMTGLTAYREGNVIDLGFTQLQVVDACSGLRYLIPLVMLGLLLAYYFNAARWKKVLLIVSTVPLTVITNSFRIASVGILYQFWGASVAEGFFHDFSGWLIFMVSLSLLLFEIWLLRRLGNKSQIVCEPSPSVTEVADQIRFPWLMILLSFVLLIGTVAATSILDFREKVPVARPLTQFPLEIGEWRGLRSALNAEVLATLHLSDYLMADFRNQHGKVVSIYVAYNESQRKGESSHSPASCLPGNGWVFEESGLVSVQGASGPIKARRAYMQKSGDRMLVYYWFPQRGRVLTSMLQLKLYAFWDALSRHRTDGALVRLITPLDSGESIEQAEERLRDFARQVVPILNKYLPGNR